MKQIFALTLLVILSVNSIAAAAMCEMQHQPKSMQDHTDPCHDAHKSSTQDINAHLCDCDKSTQYAHIFMSISLSPPAVEAPYIIDINHQSLTTSPKYRPPIYLST